MNAGLAPSVLGWAAACQLVAEEARPYWVEILQAGLEEESQEQQPAALRALPEEARSLVAR